MDNDNADTFVVQGMPRAAMLEEGEVIEIELTVEGDRALKLHFSPIMLETFLARGSEVAARGQAKAVQDGGQLRIRAREADAVSAAAPKGGGKVLLSIRPRGGAPQYFAIGTDLAAKLRPQLRKAEEAAANAPVTPSDAP